MQSSLHGVTGAMVGPLSVPYIGPLSVPYMYERPRYQHCYKNHKFTNYTKLCHRTRNNDDITELQGDIKKLAEWENKWQVNISVDNSSVMHISSNNIYMKTISDRSSVVHNRSTARSRRHHHRTLHVSDTRREKLQTTRTKTWK